MSYVTIKGLFCFSRKWLLIWADKNAGPAALAFDIQRWYSTNSSLFSSWAGRTSELWSNAPADPLSPALVTTTPAAPPQPRALLPLLVVWLPPKGTKRRIRSPHQLLSSHIWCIVCIPESTSLPLSFLPACGTRRVHQHRILISVRSCFAWIAHAKGHIFFSFSSPLPHGWWQDIIGHGAQYGVLSDPGSTEGCGQEVANGSGAHRLHHRCWQVSRPGEWPDCAG